MTINDSSTDQFQRWTTVLLGNNAVGKTALLERLSGDKFDNDPSARVTVTKPVYADRESDVVDLSGMMSEEQIVQTLQKSKLAVAIIVVDASRLHDMEQGVQHWTRLLARAHHQVPPTRLLVAARADKGYAIDRGLLNEVADKHGFEGLYITSSKDGTGIQELRSGVLAAVDRRRQDRNDDAVTAVVRAMAEALCELIARDPHALRRVEWRDLERVVAGALRQLGFTVELTPASKDGGKDIVATCIAQNARKVFYVEVKHWTNGDRPGPRHVTDFIEVNARDGTDGGLFLSSSGYTTCVHTRLAEISRQRVRLGEQEKIVSLCQQYVRSKRGLWCPERPLPELLFDETL